MGYGKDGKGKGGWGKGGGGWGMDPWMMMGMMPPLPASKSKGKGGGGRGGGGGKPTHVFVGGVKGDPSEEDVRAAFGVYGEIADVNMKRHEDGTLKGYFFVVFAEASSAEECKANCTEFLGEKVDVKSADGGSSGKTGDWTCPMCYDLVFSWRDTCNKCGYYGGMWGVGGGKGKGGGKGDRRPGDWTCPSCGDNVFARRTNCNKCGAEKPEGASPY